MGRSAILQSETCCVEGCDEPIYVRGKRQVRSRFCYRHYRAAYYDDAAPKPVRVKLPLGFPVAAVFEAWDAKRQAPTPVYLGARQVAGLRRISPVTYSAILLGATASVLVRGDETLWSAALVEGGEA